MVRAAILGVVASLLLLPEPARGQPTDDPQFQAHVLDLQIRDLDDIARKIRGENYRVVIGGTVGDPQAVLVSPEQVESLFVYALLNGSMKPNQAAGLARSFGMMTRQYLEEIENELRILRQRRARLAAGAGITGTEVVDAPVPVTSTRTGTATGQWSAGCSWTDPTIARSTDGGTFTVTFDGRGGVAGSYQGANGTYGVDGNLAADGTANGRGAGSGWSVSWSGRFDVAGAGTVGSGGLRVTITELGGGSCTGTWAVP